MKLDIKKGNDYNNLSWIGAKFAGEWWWWSYSPQTLFVEPTLWFTGVSSLKTDILCTVPKQFLLRNRTLLPSFRNVMKNLVSFDLSESKQTNTHASHELHWDGIFKLANYIDWQKVSSFSTYHESWMMSHEIHLWKTDDDRSLIGFVNYIWCRAHYDKMNEYSWYDNLVAHSTFAHLISTPICLNAFIRLPFHTVINYWYFI